MKAGKKSRFRYGFEATFLTVFFIILVIMINLLTVAVCDRFPSVNRDLSENGQFKLSDETVSALSGLDKDIKITVVLYNNEQDMYYNEFLGRYREISKRISYVYIDPVKNPSAVNKYSDDIDPGGSFIIECGERHEVIDATLIDGAMGRMEEAELVLTNAIVSLSSDKKNTVGFTVGHGEGEFDGLKKIFENKYFDVKDVDLKSADIKNLDMMVIACPIQDFTQQELDQLEKFSRNGKSVQIYLDPQARTLPSLFQYIKEWGIDIRDEIVKENDPSRVYADYNGYVPQIIESDYTKGISNKYPLIYEPAYRLDILYSGIKSTDVTEILKTSPKATTLSDGNESNTTDSYNIALVSERIPDGSVETMKLFVAGSSLNLKYSYEEISGIPANKQLANALISKMSGAGSYIDITAKNTRLRAFAVTAAQAVFIAVLILLIAIGVIITGIIIWKRRRFL